jgi:acetyl esterase/lipase
LLTGISLACGGGDLGPGLETGPPAHITVVSGEAQVGTVGEALAQPVVVRVTDAAGSPVPGEKVGFAGGTWSADTVRSDADGKAAALWTLDTRAGQTVATAGVQGLDAVEVTARAVAGTPATLAFDQSPPGGVAGETFEPPVGVVVEDRYGNVVTVSDATVTLHLNHGTLLGTSVLHAVSGSAVFGDLHVDEPGVDFVLTASSPAISEAVSVPFDIVGQPATTLEVAAGDDQTGAAGASVAVAPTVVARDVGGRPVPGMSVRFTVVDGGGSVTPSQAVTDADGKAVATDWTLGHTAGANSLEAELIASPGVTVRFHAMAVAGPVDPVRSKLTVNPPTVAVGEASTIRVVAQDAFDNPVQGATVVVSASGSDNTLTQPSPTNAAGVASGTLLATSAGTRTVTAAVNGVALAQQATVSVGSGDDGSITVTPASASLLPGRTLQLTATVRDASGAPVNAPVTWKSSKVAIATVGSDGVVTAIKPGTATIRATSGTAQATSEITVSYGPGTVTGLPYCTMGGGVERMDIYGPAADVPRPLAVAVHIHGGGWVSGNRTRGVWFAPIRDRLLADGFLVVSIDYRLAPEDKWPAQIRDVKCAIRHLRANADRYGLDPDRIGVVGSSAGGQLAALLGTTEPVAGIDDVGDFQGVSSQVQAVVALSPITDFTTIEELRDDYSRVFLTWPDPDSPEMIAASPITHVTPGDSPFFFVAGEDDALVLPEQSARMHRRLLDAGVASTLVMIAHADHGLGPTTAPISPTMDEVIDRIEGFLDQRLR